MSGFKLTSGGCATLFDVVAEESLRGSMKPAWEYVCRIAKLKYPILARKILCYSDEIFAVVLLLLEEYNLRNKSATITESFYELSRESTSQSDSFLFRNAKWISVFSVVVLPYVTEKLEKYFNSLNNRELSGEELIIIEKRFLAFYPFVLTITKWIRVLNYARYLFKFTGHAVPLLWLTGIQLKYATNNSDSIQNMPQKGPLYSRILRKIPDLTASMLAKLAPLLFYSLQFMDMCFDEHTGLSKVVASLPVPPAPPIPKVASTCLKLPPSAKQCPLCRNTHTNPTTIVNSGFVFCYTCLHQYIIAHGCCPITYRTCGVDDMIRIYPS